MTNIYIDNPLQDTTELNELIDKYNAIVEQFRDNYTYVYIRSSNLVTCDALAVLQLAGFKFSFNRDDEVLIYK